VSTVNGQAVVLLIDPDHDTRELEDLILTDAGYRVVIPPANLSPVSFAAQLRPQVIVAHVRPNAKVKVDLVDQLQADPTSRLIPVVTIAAGEQLAAQAQAGPNVIAAVVAPYDITSLVAAVRTALGHPPPAATLPPPVRPQPAAVAFAATQLVQHARQVVLQTLDRLRQTEPYKSRFDELSVGLVDELGILIGAIATGWQRGLAPSDVFAAAEVQHAINQHGALRRRQGIGLSGAVREMQAFRHQVVIFLEGLAGQSGFTGQDTANLSREVGDYFDVLTPIIIARFQSGSGPAPAT
jgi:DNA-binding response OmpR family regulator